MNKGDNRISLQCDG